MPVITDKTCPGCQVIGRHLGSDMDGMAVYKCETSREECRIIQYYQEYEGDSITNTENTDE